MFSSEEEAGPWLASTTDPDPIGSSVRMGLLQNASDTTSHSQHLGEPDWTSSYWELTVSRWRPGRP